MDTLDTLDTALFAGFSRYRRSAHVRCLGGAGAGAGCWLLVTSGHVTINPPRAVPAWVPDLEWVRGATWVVSGVMTIETFTSTSCHLNIG